MPVLVLTADARGDLDERLRAAGADAVLAKPADPQQLLAEVTRLMDPVRIRIPRFGAPGGSGLYTALVSYVLQKRGLSPAANDGSG